MNNKDKIIDVDYTEEDIDVITNELDSNKVYFTTGQAAQMLGVQGSKLRYWTNFFAKRTDDDTKDLILVKYSNKNRAYSMDNINDFKRIKELTEDYGMTLQQAKEYTSENGFDAENKSIDSNNPLALTAFVAELTNDINNKLNNFENRIVDKVLQAMDEKNNELLMKQEAKQQILKQEIAITVDQVINDNINQNLGSDLKEINSNINNYAKNITEELSKKFIDQQNEFDNSIKQQETKLDEFLAIQSEESKKQIQQFEELKQKMEERKKEYEESSSKKGFFSKFFK
ncbi:MAG: MerR family transcriptional regulator [Bacilli bacterium]